MGGVRKIRFTRTREDTKGSFTRRRGDAEGGLSRGEAAIISQAPLGGALRAWTNPDCLRVSAPPRESKFFFAPSRLRVNQHA
jgi:hypothetical protein